METREKATESQLSGRQWFCVLRFPKTVRRILCFPAPLGNWEQTRAGSAGWLFIYHGHFSRWQCLHGVELKDDNACEGRGRGTGEEMPTPYSWLYLVGLIEEQPTGARAKFKGPKTSWIGQGNYYPGPRHRCEPQARGTQRVASGACSGLQNEVSHSRENERDLVTVKPALLIGTTILICKWRIKRGWQRAARVEWNRARNLEKQVGSCWIRNPFFPVRFFSLYFLFNLFLFSGKLEAPALAGCVKEANGKGVVSTLGQLNKMRGSASLERVIESWRTPWRRWGSGATGPFLPAQVLFPRRASLIPSEQSWGHTSASRGGTVFPGGGKIPVQVQRRKGAKNVQENGKNSSWTECSM